MPQLTIRAATTWLPPTRYPAEWAVADGRLDPADREKLRIAALPVADEAAPVMAVRAARDALEEAGVPAGELGALVHAWIHHQGHDFWSPAHYIADQLGASHAVPFGVQQMCNGGAMAVELAADRLAADPLHRPVLVTTADRFCEPGFDRWRGDYGVVYGDGATAVVLSRPADGDTGLRLLSMATSAASDLETVHRGQDEFSPAAGWHSRTVDVRRTKKAFLSEHGPDRLTRATVTHLSAVLGTVLDRAGLRADDPRIRYVTLPRLGRAAIETSYLPALAGLWAEPLDLGADTGHLGAGDAVAGLAALCGTGLLQPGEVGVVCSGGGGFTWSCLLVQAL